MTIESQILGLILQGMPIAGLAENARTDPIGVFYLALHTAEPVSGGPQTANEMTYAGYTRLPIIRGVDGWTLQTTLNRAVPAQTMAFAKPVSLTGLPQTATHVSVGTEASGAGLVLFKGPLSAAITVAALNDQPGLRPTPVPV